MSGSVENFLRGLWLPGVAAVIVMGMAAAAAFAGDELPQKLVEVKAWQGGNGTIVVDREDKLVVTSGHGGTWIHTSDGEQLHHFKQEEMGGNSGHNHVQFSPNGKLVFLYNRDGNVWVCSVDDRECEIALPGTPTIGRLGVNEACQDVNTPPKDLPKSPVIRQLGYAISKSRDGKLYLYNPQGIQMSAVDIGPKVPCKDIDIIERTVERGGKKIQETLVYATHENGKTYVVSYSDGARKWIARSLPGNIGFGGSVTCDPSRRRVAAGGRKGTIHVWECGSHKLVDKIEAGNGTHLVEGVAYSRDGKYLASVSGRVLQVWDAVTSELVAERTEPAQLNDIVWDPSQYIYTVDSFGRVKKWRLEPNEEDDPPKKTPLEPPPVSTPKPTPTPSQQPTKPSLGLIYDPASDDPAFIEDPTLILEPDPEPTPDPYADSDADGLTDEDEYTYGTDPHNPDTDAGGVMDGQEVSEGTDPLNPEDDYGLYEDPSLAYEPPAPDPTVYDPTPVEEPTPTPTPTPDPATMDSDADGLTDEDEATYGTDPYNPDTDAGGVIDADEVAAGTDPLNPEDDYGLYEDPVSVDDPDDGWTEVNPWPAY